MRYVCPECFGQGKLVVHSPDCDDEFCRYGVEQDCPKCATQGYPPSIEIFQPGTKLARNEAIDVQFTVIEVKELP